MKKKLLLLFLTVIMATCFVCGLTSVAFAAENNCGCTIATARDDGEGEYRVHLSGEGITDGSFDDTKIKINDKTLKTWKDEGKITQVYSRAEAGANLVRIDLPNYAAGILKLDGTDTVTLLDGFKVGASGAAQAGEYVQTLSEMKVPSVKYGFAEGVEIADDVITAKNGTLEFTPVFTAGVGESLQKTSVKLNDVELKADENGKYVAKFGFGTSKLVFHAENVAAPNAFVEKTVTIKYSDPVVEGPVYVSVANFKRNVEGRPSFKDRMSIRFSNVISTEDQAKLTLSINGKDLTALGSKVSVSWTADGRQADVKTLFFQAGTKAQTEIYKYDGTDEIVVGGVTAEANTLKMTSDGQVYNVTRNEEAPAYKGDGYITVKEISVVRDHEGKHKDAIHIFFNENVDIKGAAYISEGVLLFNTGTILINGHNLQAFWDGNHSTTAYWLNSANPYIRIDVFYDGLSSEMWNRNGENTITMDAGFITMTDIGLGKGFGDYTYDAADGVTYAPGEKPEDIALTLGEMQILKEIEAGNDWIKFCFEQDVFKEMKLNIQSNAKIIDNIMFNGRTLTELKAELAKCEIHAGVEGPNVLRMTISSANDHADLKKLLKMDGTDEVVLKAGLGLNKYQCVKEDLTVSGLNDVAAPVITVERPDKPVNEAQYEIKFSVADDSEYDVVVKLGDTVIEPIEGKYIVTLVNGVNNITVTVKDKSIFANSSTETLKVKYEAIPKISISGITDGTTVKTAGQKMTVSVDIGEITSVKLGEKVLTAGTDGKYALALAEGENTIVIEAKNGETKGTLSIKVTLDTTAPEIVLSAKEETVASAEYTFTVKAEDAETIVVKVNGEAVTAGGNGYTVTLKEGENKITVTATDAAGNISSESVTVTYTPAGGNTDNGNESKGCGGNFATDSLIIAIGLIACAAFVLRRKVR